MAEFEHEGDDNKQTTTTTRQQRNKDSDGLGNLKRMTVVCWLGQQSYYCRDD